MAAALHNLDLARPIDGPHDAAQLFAPIAQAGRETAIIAYFDPKWRLLGLRHVPSTQRDAVTIPVRDIVIDALAFDAVAVMMAHNHPSGDPTPSAADHTLTRRLARGLGAVGVVLADHFVLAGTETVSFRRNGLL